MSLRGVLVENHRLMPGEANDMEIFDHTFAENLGEPKDIEHNDRGRMRYFTMRHGAV
jgi:hypothetical protein